jgi:hypothetical protein
MKYFFADLPTVFQNLIDIKIYNRYHRFNAHSFISQVKQYSLPRLLVRPANHRFATAQWG